MTKAAVTLTVKAWGGYACPFLLCIYFSGVEDLTQKN
jgi:hypothetical protein